MTEEMKSMSSTTNVSGLAKLREICGPPPVLSSENMTAYDEMLARLMKCKAPQDLFEEILIKEVVDNTWEMARYTRHKNLLVERRFRDRLAFQAERKKAAAQKKEAFAKRLAAGKPEPPTEPDEVLEGLVEEVDAILQQSATELDHARALEVGIVYLERLDKLLMTATARRNNALEQLERYRDGLGYRLRSISDDIIEGKCNGVEAVPAQLEPPVVPPPEQSQ